MINYKTNKTRLLVLSIIIYFIFIVLIITATAQQCPSIYIVENPPNNYIWATCGNATDGICPEDFQTCDEYGQNCQNFSCGNCYDPDCAYACNLTSASITPNCGTDDCDVGETINVQANFNGSCMAVTTLKVRVSNLTGGNSFIMSIPCNLSQGQLACSDDFDLPICYDGQIFTIKNASAYDANNVLIDYNDTAPYITGDFQFDSQCSQLISIDEKPDFVGMIMGQSVHLTVNATFMKAGNIFYEDITLSPHTNYLSNDSFRIGIERDSTGVWATALAPGFAYINATYPFGFSDSKTDTSYFVVGPYTGCTINSASIDLTDCGNDGCNVSEKINMTLSTSGCATFLSEGGYIIMRADDNGNCSVTMNGSFDSACVNCNATWTITNTNVDWANCSGKTVNVKHVELWNKTAPWPIGASQGNFGSFQFWKPMPSEPSYITIWPRDWAIKVGDNVSYEVWAHYNDGSSLNATLADETNYSSSDTTVAYQITPKNVFYGNSTGQTTINASYPQGHDYAKWNSTLLYVNPATDCEIINANITPDCEETGSNPICDNGDTIELGVFVNQKCRDLNIAKIQMRAHQKFGNVNGNDCSFDMNASFTANDCQQNGDWFCHGTWQVDVPQGCEGKNVIVDAVAVYNYSGNFLDSKQGYIGNFTFVQTPLALRAIIVEPSDGATFNLSENPLANFTQASIGEINNWSWWYRKEAIPQLSWTLLRSTSDPSEANITNYNFAYYEWKGGNYEINLTVENASMSDDDTVEITLIDEYTPIANITKPLRHDILYNNTVRFESNCFDPNNDPMNVTWYFDDGTNVSGSYSEYQNVTHIFGKAKPGFFKAQLNATDGQNSSVDSVEFVIAYCNHNGNYSFAGSCIGEGNLYCNKSDCNASGECSVVADCRVCDNCLQEGKICDYLTGNCTNGPTNNECANCMGSPPCDPSMCNSQQAQGCYWDPCKSCIESPPESCSDYKQVTCAADPCRVGYENGGLGTEICGQVIETPPGSGNYSLVTDCHCEWNTSVNNCTLAYTLFDQSNPGPGPGPGQECQYRIDSADCGSCQVGGREGRNITYQLVSGGSDCPATTSRCQPCGLVFRPLPFFEWWNAIIVVSAIVLIYAFIISKKRKKIES